MSITATASSGSGPSRYRRPAPLEDTGPQVEAAVFGAAAGHSGADARHDGADATLRVMEWVAKRTWHVLGLPYNREDRKGPPAMKAAAKADWMEVAGTVLDGGVPLRNQVIACEVEQLDEPILVLLRSTDAFGEVLIELDLRSGVARARSVTVSRSMIGGQSHSSPMPEQSSNRIIAEARFPPPPPGPVELRIRALGEHIALSVNGEEVFAFADPDPAGGKFGFGSTGRMRIRNVQQLELVSPAEKERREACIREMYAFCRQIDTCYDDDVRARNRLESKDGGVLWTWPTTGATASLQTDGPRILGTVRAGLYGNDTLVDGPFPEIVVVGADGQEYIADPARTAAIEADPLAIRMILPLIDPAGRTAVARVLAKLTVQTVWFWTVTIEGFEPLQIDAFIGLAPEFGADSKSGDANGSAGGHLKRPGKHEFLRHNAKAGIFAKALDSSTTGICTHSDRAGDLGFSTTASALRFATVVLPAQSLNKVGFKHRMVHYIRYPEGPIQHWRRRPSFQEYPTNVDLARYAGHGTDAMVWHHTWIGDDYRDREGFLVNHDEMKRAMNETHRLGMKMIGYLGIVPGRSSLLRFEDTCPLGGRNTYGGYDKNWDLQDFTFYHVNGRYPEFLAWLTDYLCREYGIDGYYLDGGAFGQISYGPTTEPLHPEDADLSLDELAHRAYWRVKKVLELSNAGYGLEPWSGLNWMLNGFYDCMMIGESFQEAPPEYYRDGHNALLTGCMIKMYGMRESSQNPYNIAMAAVNLSDIQVCSGNGAWGDVADTTDTWARVRPLWDILDSIDWDNLVDARPWYAQELVRGEGFYAANYTTPGRAILFLANRGEEPGSFGVEIDVSKLPPIKGTWHARYCLGRTGEIGPLGDGRLQVELPALHDGPIGIELVAGE